MTVIEEFGFGESGMQRQWLLTENKVIRMGLSANRIALLTGISGVEFRECKPRACAGEIDGVPVRIIGLDDVRRNKKASGRLKDLNYVEHLPK